jgi:protein TonB
MGIMAAPAPLPTRSEPPEPGSDDIFTSLVESNPPPRHGLRAWPVSATIHLAVIAAIFILPLYWSDILPRHPDYVAFLVYDPPAAASAPLAKGREQGATREKPKTQPDLKPEKVPVLQDPMEVPVERPVEPDKTPALDKEGDPNGSDKGILDGSLGGQDGGVLGGVDWGTVGGCVGCTGTGPVLNPDEIPRLIKHVDPLYPQDAFVKKIEGTVLVEALVDATGHVVKARVLRSIPVLDAAALAAVKLWEFVPARQHGVAVATIIQANIRFRIF